MTPQTLCALASLSIIAFAIWAIRDAFNNWKKRLERALDHVELGEI